MTPASVVFDDDAAIGVLSSEADQLITALQTTDGSAGVPFCPGWSATDLAIHLGGVFRWVNTVISERRTSPPVGDERRQLFADPEPQDGAGVLDRLRGATDAILASLTDAPKGLACWTIWDPPGDAREFWVRRLLFETLVHRVDAQNAQHQRVGSGSDIDTALAADGVDELICGFARRYESTLRSDQRLTLALRATDADRSWWVEITPDPPRFGRGEPEDGSSAELRGRAGELLLVLWNRRDAEGLEIVGDSDVVKIWRAGSHL
jgi:uncharacterized protein (TIGR03083 family)